jgi:hypothetical protein
MKNECLMRAHQLSRFAQFLEEHPAFSPLLVGENALVCGFQVGNSFLGVDDMETIIAAEPHFDGRQAELLLAPIGVRARAG